MYVHIYSACYISVSMRLQKEARQVNQSNLKGGNIGIGNMNKKYRRSIPIFPF